VKRTVLPRRLKKYFCSIIYRVCFSSSAAQSSRKRNVEFQIKILFAEIPL